MTILATDNFTRADNADLGTAWDENTGDSSPNGLNISANTAVPADVTLDSSETNNTVTWPNDQYSECTFGATAADGVGSGVGVTCREATGATVTYYRAVGNASGFQLSRAVAGAFTSLSSGAGTTFTAGDKLRLQVKTNGANADWVLFKSGVSFASGSDTSPIASGRAGVGHSSTSTVASLSAWEGGDLTTSVVGSPIGSNAFHPGRSPGLGGISSARFQPSNWWPYSPPALVVFDPAFMAAMNRPWPDTVFSPPQVVASGMTPPEEVPS